MVMTSALVGRSSRSGWDWRLWWRWVVANSLGELVGLGLTGVITVVLIQAIPPGAVAQAIGIAVLAVATGMLIEGLTVGVAQWAALRRVFPTVSLGRWAVATAIGAGIAWALGMAPSTLMALSESSTEAAAAPEISEAMVYVLAAGMGVALGPMLGIAQWIVLRQVAWNASIWIPAQSVAWAIGMPVVFFGVSLIGERGVSVVSVTGALAALAVAGAAVGATHGVALLWLAQRPRIAPKP